jgi:anaerobic selenocysteine-containing dehydrogenase
MLGLAHTLIATERADLEFFARYCTGYEAWRAYLLGETDGIESVTSTLRSSAAFASA